MMHGQKNIKISMNVAVVTCGLLQLCKSLF